MLFIGKPYNTPKIDTSTGKKLRRKTDLKSSDLYKYYISNKLGEKISKEEYDSIIELYNKKLLNRIIAGERVRLYPSLGEMMVIEIHRKDFIVHGDTKDILPNTKGVDWGLTNKLNIRNDAGKLVRQYFKSSEQSAFYKMFWMRTFANATNVSLYKFIRSLKARKMLPDKIKSDDMVTLHYGDNTKYVKNPKKHV